MKVEPVCLDGDFVRLEPLRTEHVDALAEFAFDDSLWRWTTNVMRNLVDLKRYVEIALDERHRGVSVPFVTVEKASDRIVGSTRFGNIDLSNRKAEIGWTWIDPHWQRTFVNTEAKLLMLSHAFEIWKCIRVELKTDALNEKSRNAVLRIGATEEGVLRNHMITDTGRFRDTAYFSIIENEWDAVKANLKEKLRSNE